MVAIAAKVVGSQGVNRQKDYFHVWRSFGFGKTLRIAGGAAMSEEERGCATVEPILKKKGNKDAALLNYSCRDR
jgi:hypothetical protein